MDRKWILLSALIISILAVGSYQIITGSQNVSTTPSSTITSPITFSTNSYICTNSSNQTKTVRFPNDSLSGCILIMSYSFLDSLISQGASSYRVNGTIVIKTGVGAACTENFYILPNGTDIDWYAGASSASQTCS